METFTSCEEPRPSSAAVPVADEIITFLREAKIENRQIDRAMSSMGFEENVIVASCPGARSAQGLCTWVWGSWLAWNLSFAHERGATIAAAWN